MTKLSIKSETKLFFSLWLHDILGGRLMSKEKRVYLVFLFIIVVVVIAALLIRRQATTNEDITPILETIKTSTREAVLFEDEAGFSFKYYNDLTVADITPDDDEHYSLLSVIDKDKKQLIQIKLIDTKYKKLNDWLLSWETAQSTNLKKLLNKS